MPVEQKNIREGIKLYTSTILHHLWIHCWAQLYTHHFKFQMLDFAVWLSVIAENYQVNFHLPEDNQLKSIPKNITTKNYFLCIVKVCEDST